MKKVLLLIFILTNLVSYTQDKKTIELNLASFKNKSHEYYYELLTKSLENIGYQVIINSQKEMPQTRITESLKSGILTLHWYVGSAEKDNTYVPVEVNLTNNLIGHRILFIKKGDQASFNDIKNLSDLSNSKKIGGFGKNWFDVNVWKLNNLKYKEQPADWRHLYKMVGSGDRGIDYFSRGVIEILPEYSRHKDYLDIEQNLLLIYDRDFKFYLSKKDIDKKEILEKALTKAKKDGLIDELVRKYWKEDFEKLNINNRIKIKLQTP